MSTTPPPIGSMYMYDCVTPPLTDGSYRIDVVTNVTYDGETPTLQSNSGYFDIEGPRFTLPATDVGGVYPPRNGHGGFDEYLPQIAISRRTLPWERRLTTDLSKIGTPKSRGNQFTPQPNPFPPRDGEPQFAPTPWMALLLLAEGEYTLHQNVSLKSVMPAENYAALDVPDGITCDSIEVEVNLLDSILPSLDELTLLTHVRQVNVDDKELNAASSTGFYAIVTSNRLPAPNAKYRACLVSLEERTDLVQADPPPVASPPFISGLGGVIFNRADLAADIPPVINEFPFLGLAPARRAFNQINGAIDEVGNVTGTVLETVADRNVSQAIDVVQGPAFHFYIETKQLVLLHSWTFECTGMGTFRDYVQRVNVSTMGTVEETGHPPVIDTGHIPIKVMDRAGEEEDVWYRGPLVPMPLTRDPLTYHSADQCRRVTPETGAEDISYAAAFECGRLLAAADPRLAQELMRWRRESYRQSVRLDSLLQIQAAFPLDQQLEIHKPVASVVAYNAAKGVVTGVDQVADTYGLNAASRAPGLNPVALQEAWSLSSVTEATAILGGEPGATGVAVTAPAQTSRSATTLGQVAADAASLTRLQAARDLALTAAQQKMGI